MNSSIDQTLEFNIDIRNQNPCIASLIGFSFRLGSCQCSSIYYPSMNCKFLSASIVQLPRTTIKFNTVGSNFNFLLCFLLSKSIESFIHHG